MSSGRHRGRRRGPERVTSALALAIALVVAGGTGGTAQAATGFGTPFDGFDAAGVTPLAAGHSHNDYDQRRPLTDALRRGYTSIEADVVLVGGKLMVGHDLVTALVRGATLRKLYLDPLREWVRQNDGRVFRPGSPALTLMIDVKSDGERTWKALEAVLSDYQDMLTRWTPDEVEPGAVNVILSGNTVPELLADDDERLAALDGRAADLAAAEPASPTLIPMISERWGALFSWKGSGPMPADQRARLEQLVRTAHAQGRTIRFFATPARSGAVRAAVWRTELAAGVDLLNVDDLAAGQRFLLERTT